LAVLLLSVTSSCLHLDQNGQGRRLKRQSDVGDFKQGCTTTGYESRFRELCEEEFEEVCKTVTAVEYKKEIVTKCDTRLEQRCNTTIRAVPRQTCVPRNRTECIPDFRIVTETSFTSECENIVQHICEEHYNVPVPHHVPLSHPHVPFGPQPRGKRRKKRASAILDKQRLLLDLKSALHLAAPPLVSHQELPAPPGCRSLVTQKCRKVPIEVVRKVPADQCEEVPGVRCFLELVDEEHPQCFEVPVQECVDELLESPYLVDEEECEDVPKLVCTEIEEQVPIQVCKTVDVLRTPIVVGKGRRRETTVSGLGVRAKVVGRLPDVGSVGGEKQRGGRGSARLRIKEKLKPEVIEKLRSQIFDKTEQRNKRAKSPRGSLDRERMRAILKQFINEQLQK